MNYELAKKLKDAGFPFRAVQGCSGPDCSGIVVHFGETNIYYPPTLSELIKACGNKFRGIEIGDWTPVRWHAKTKSDEISQGITPEEAVAHLWLELNKKV